MNLDWGGLKLKEFIDDYFFRFEFFEKKHVEKLKKVFLYLLAERYKNECDEPTFMEIFENYLPTVL